MEWRIVPGAPYGPEDASIIGPRLQALAEDGLLTPDDVVEDARPKGSELHDYFEWDDLEAARRFRREQARKMIQAVEIIPAEQKEPIRYFHYVKQEIAAEPETPGEEPPAPRFEYGFATLDRVRREETLMSQVVAAARKELIGWRKRYGQYEELERETKAVTLALQIPVEAEGGLA